MKRFLLVCIFLGTVTGLQAMGDGFGKSMVVTGCHIARVWREPQNHFANCEAYLNDLEQMTRMEDFDALKLLLPDNLVLFLLSRAQVAIGKRYLRKLRKRRSRCIAASEGQDGSLVEAEGGIETCGICTEEYSKDRRKIKLHCDPRSEITHDYCSVCLSRWVQERWSDKCPTCRTPGLMAKLVAASNSPVAVENNNNI